MIEIRKNTDPRDARRAHLFIDGELLNNVLVGTNWDSGNSCSITSYDFITSKILAAHRVSDFPIPPDHIDLQYYPDDLPHMDKERGVVVANYIESHTTLILSFGADVLTQWTAPYTFADYVYELYSILEGRDDVYDTELSGKDEKLINYTSEVLRSGGSPIDWYRESGYYQSIEGKTERVRLSLNEIDKSRIHTLHVTFMSSRDAVISDEVERISGIMREIHTEILSRISHSVVIAFDDFPAEVKVPCEQYLLYFIQFLKDIGIEATADIRHEAQTVLFSVTPKDKTEALVHIRRALEVYLTLPTNPNLNASFGLTGDPRTQQLIANIQHLQGQLVLANAAMQWKDATIQQQQLTIQQRQLTGEVLIESVRIGNSPEEDKEKVLGGTVAITKWKWKFLEFDMPDIWRRIKQFVFEQDED